MGTKKQPRIAESPKVAKKPSIGVRFNPGAYSDLRPTWRLRRLRVRTPYGWHEITREQMLRVIGRLRNLESMAWKEIEGPDSHWITADKIIPDARKCLEEDWQGADRVFSLRVDGATRVFGIIDEAVFYLLWYDPNHQICPSPKKNT